LAELTDVKSTAKKLGIELAGHEVPQQLFRQSFKTTPLVVKDEKEVAGKVLGKKRPQGG
jgi:hypothetical protein